MFSNVIQIATDGSAAFIFVCRIGLGQMRHIEIRYVHRIINYEETDKEKRNVEVPLSTKECSEADFSLNEEMMEVFEHN